MRSALDLERVRQLASGIPIAAVAFAVALLVRLVYLYQIRSIPFFDTPTVDGRFYDQWAQRIAAGQWWDGDVFFLAPAYPYFLALVYTAVDRSLLVVHLIQMVLGAGSCALLAGAGRRFFGNRTGMAAGLLLAVYPPAIFFDGIIHKAGLVLFLTTLLLYLLARSWDGPRWPALFACGFVTALLTLTQENMLILFLVVPAWLLLRNPEAAPSSSGRQPSRSDRLRQTATFLAGGACILTLVAIRNYTVGRVAALTTSNVGQNFYIGNNPDATGLYDSFYHGRQDPVQERKDAIRLAEQATGRQLTPGEASAFWFRRGLEFIREQPGAWVRLLLRKALLTINRFETPDAEDVRIYAEWSPLLGAGYPVFHFGVLLPLGLCGIALTSRDWRRLWPLYLMLFAVAASVTLFFVFARFRLPLVPLLAMFGGAGMVSLFGHLRQLSRGFTIGHVRPVALAAGVAVIAALLANWPLVATDRYHSIGLVNLGSLLRQEGRLVEAQHYLQRALAAHPGNEFAWYQIGMLERDRGRDGEAEEQLKRAAGIQPTFAEPFLALARLYAEQNRVDESVAHYRRVIQLRPQEPTPRLELARLLARAGRGNEAARELELLARLTPEDVAVQEALARLRDQTPGVPPPGQDQRQAQLRAADEATAVGRFADAISAYKKVLERWPDDIRAHLGLANAYRATGRTSQAKAYLQRTVELDPSHAPARTELGRILAEEGRFESAIAHYQRALAAEPTSVPARYNLATALAALGRLDEAIAAMEACLEQARAADRKELLPWIEDRLDRLRAERGSP